MTDKKIWAAGWVIPGYLPDIEAEFFEDWHNARRYLAEELESMQRNFQYEDTEDCLDALYCAALMDLDHSTPDTPWAAQVGGYVWWIDPATGR